MNLSVKSLLSGLGVGLCFVALSFWSQQESDLEQADWNSSYAEEIVHSDVRAKKNRSHNSDGDLVIKAPVLDVYSELSPEQRIKATQVARRFIASYEAAQDSGDYASVLQEAEAARDMIKDEYEASTGKKYYSYLNTDELEKKAAKAVQNKLIAPEEYEEYLQSLVSAAEIENSMAE